jgi:sugar O-acyltransferase (sialic acid O-acetyltransferase NeuD family)
MPIKQIAIYGAGGFAREVAWLVQACNEKNETYQVVCFIDDNLETHNKILNGIPVMGLEETRKRFPNASVVAGVGSPQTRQRLMEKASAMGFDFGTIVHPRTERSAWIKIDVGTVICAGNILTTNIIIGRHVQLNLDCTVGHDVIFKDYATLAPGVHISGCVHLGQRVYVGTGAVIINGTQDKPVVIGDDVVIGAGACVTKSVPAGETVVGIPAKPLVRS